MYGIHISILATFLFIWPLVEISTLMHEYRKNNYHNPFYDAPRNVIQFLITFLALFIIPFVLFGSYAYNPAGFAVKYPELIAGLLLYFLTACYLRSYKKTLKSYVES